MGQKLVSNCLWVLWDITLVRTHAGTLRALVTNEQEVTECLAVKGKGCGNARVNAGNGNALPAKGKGKGRGRGRQ